MLATVHRSRPPPAPHDRWHSPPHVVAVPCVSSARAPRSHRSQHPARRARSRSGIGDVILDLRRARLSVIAPSVRSRTPSLSRRFRLRLIRPIPDPRRVCTRPPPEPDSGSADAGWILTLSNLGAIEAAWSLGGSTGRCDSRLERASDVRHRRHSARGRAHTIGRRSRHRPVTSSGFVAALAVAVCPRSRALHTPGAAQPRSPADLTHDLTSGGSDPRREAYWSLSNG
jgi:hypothetical protein